MKQDWSKTFVKDVEDLTGCNTLAAVKVLDKATTLIRDAIDTAFAVYIGELKRCHHCIHTNVQAKDAAETTDHLM